MTAMSNTKKLVFASVCIAMCLVLPMAFHTVQNAGAIFLPMHIPVLLCGLICGWQYGLICGLTGPLISSLITSMPAMAILPSMMVELAVYGLVCGVMMKFVKTKSTYADLYISLVTALILGRIVSGAAKALIFNVGKYYLKMWITGSFVTALPGLIIQLVLIPTVVYALMRAKVIPARYGK